MNRITIDPGITGTGVALWSIADWSKKVVPIDARILTPDDNLDWVGNCQLLTQKLSIYVAANDVHHADVEFPQYFQSAVGHAATADGKIYKLACLIGCFMGVLWHVNARCNPILVNTWKGQLPKPAVIARIKRHLPEINDVNFKIDSHAWDAVGIGMFAKGFFGN